MRTKRFPLRPEQDELFKKLYPILLDVFCKGIIKTESKKLVLAAIGIFALIPYDIVIIIVHRSIHLLMLFLAWWVLKDDLATYQALEKIMITLALLAIFYKDIYDEIVSLLLNFSIVVTKGKFMYWLCEGYLSAKGFRHNSFTGKYIEQLVTLYVAILPVEFRDQYDELLNLHAGSNKPENEEKLTRLIEEYWQPNV